MNLLRTVVLGFLLIHCFSTSAQLRSFEDYAQCLVGFKDDDGKVILDPQFDSARRLDGRNGTAGWTVKQGENYGYVSLDGNYSVPCNYISLVPSDSNK